jgi:hypothetical protein
MSTGAIQLAGSELPQPKTFASSKDDILNALSFYFGQPVSPEKLKDYNEHHAATCTYLPFPPAVHPLISLCIDWCVARFSQCVCSSFCIVQTTS